MVANILVSRLLISDKSVQNMSRLQVARQICSYLTNTKKYDRLFAGMKLIDCNDKGNLKFQWKVDESQLNRGNTLHGGYIASAVDWTTTVALLTSQEKEMKPGVSVELSVSYLKAAKPGDLVTLETEVVKAGRTLAFLEAKLYNEAGNILATAKHTKHLAGEFKVIS